MGRILFLSAVAFLAFRYIGKSNKKHGEITAKADSSELLLEAAKEPAALITAPPAPKLLAPQSPAAEPDPRY
jgi:hypothetical protein